MSFEETSNECIPLRSLLFTWKFEVEVISSGASWLFLVFTQISLEHYEQIQGRGLVQWSFFGSCGSVFGHVFSSSRKVSCCSLQIEIYCWKSVMLVTASSAKHFLVALILSIMFIDCTGENSFCNLKLKRFRPLNFEFHKGRQHSCDISYTE